MTGTNLGKAQVADLAERGAVSVHAPDFVRLDHTGRPRFCEFLSRRVAGSSAMSLVMASR